MVSPTEMVLIRRGRPPFQGMWALPGGFVDYGETVENAVLREVREETGIEGKIISLVGVYSDPGRDPRGHTVSIAYIVVGKRDRMRRGDDAEQARIFRFPPSLSLAFDHGQIVADAVRLLREKPIREEVFG